MLEEYSARIRKLFSVGERSSAERDRGQGSQRYIRDSKIGDGDYLKNSGVAWREAPNCNIIMNIKLIVYFLLFTNTF